MSVSPQNPGLLNWVLIFLLGLIWGGAFMSVRLSLDGFPPLSVSAGRVLIAGLVLWVLGAVMGQGLRTIPSLKAWVFVTIVGAASTALPFALLSYGQQYVPSAFAGVAMGAVPLMVLPLAYIFAPEEGIGPRRIFGMVLGFVGLSILIGPGAWQNTGDGSQYLGQIACLTATLCYAGGSVVTRRAPKMPPIAFATATMLVASISLVPFALVIDGWPQSFPAVPMSALLYLALFPTALAAIIRVHVITTAGSVFMSLTSYHVPVWSVILGVTLMGETLPPQLFIALALILGGIAISQSRNLRAMFRRNQGSAS